MANSLEPGARLKQETHSHEIHALAGAPAYPPPCLCPCHRVCDHDCMSCCGYFIVSSRSQSRDTCCSGIADDPARLRAPTPVQARGEEQRQSGSQTSSEPLGYKSPTALLNGRVQSRCSLFFCSVRCGRNRDSPFFGVTAPKSSLEVEFAKQKKKFFLVVFFFFFYKD